jgi:hypothetical protein
MRLRYITQVHLEGGARHEHITDLWWSEGGVAGTATRAEMVEWVLNGGEARVRAAPEDARVEVVRATPPYLRTVANGAYTDNLLALPRF